MAEIINLRMVRKTRERAADKAQAQENRARHGRTRGERLATLAEIARTDRIVEGARIDGAGRAHGTSEPDNESDQT